MRIEVHYDDGKSVDVTHAVQIVYDSLLGSMDFGSGFLDLEELQALDELAVAAGFERPEGIVEQIARARAQGDPNDPPPSRLVPQCRPGDPKGRAGEEVRQRAGDRAVSSFTALPSKRPVIERIYLAMQYIRKQSLGSTVFHTVAMGPFLYETMRMDLPYESARRDRPGRLFGAEVVVQYSTDAPETFVIEYTQEDS
jgi:hypothetical protein